MVEEKEKINNIDTLVYEIMKWYIEKRYPEYEIVSFEEKK